MTTQQKPIILAVIGALVASSLTAAPTLAIASEATSQEAEVYTLENEKETGETILRERGRCTDSYSKEWCDAHGFQNNRPVPHKVQLTEKEAECYWGLIRNGAEWVVTAVTKDGRGFLFATADAASTLFKCLG